MPKKSYTPEEYKSAVTGMALYYAALHLKSAVDELRKTDLDDVVLQIEKIIKKVKAARKVSP